MRVLVTGGAGFIGANLVQHLVRTEPTARVTVLDALTYAGNLASLEPVADAVGVVQGDVCDERLVDRLVGGCDLVVHCAAESHNDLSLAEPSAFVRTNVTGTAVLLEAARRHGTRFHHVSTDEVYGDLALDDPARFTEASPYDPSSPYSATKAGSDLLVRAWVRSLGVVATVSNGSNTYGPYQHVEKFVPRQITNLLDGARPVVYGSGRNVRSWLHVADHVAAIWAVASRGRPGRSYLVGADDEVDNLTVVRMLLALFGRPDSDVELVADRPAHDRRYSLDSTRLRRELGWLPRRSDLWRGLEQTVEWYRENESWWRPAKAATEERYRAAGQAPLDPPTAPPGGRAAP